MSLGRFFSTLSNASSGITVWQAIGPIFAVVVTALTAFWGWAVNWGYLPVFLAGLFVFVSTLWSWVAFLWLRDRGKPTIPIQTNPIRDCSWGLEIGNIFLQYDPHNERNNWLFYFDIINTITHPLRFTIDEFRVVINRATPFADLSNIKNGSIIIAHGQKRFSLGNFARGEFTHPGSASGSIFIKMKYGHPDDGYSRAMVRSYNFDCSYRGSLPDVRIELPVVRSPIEEMDIALGKGNAAL